MINHVDMSLQMGFAAKLVELNLKSYGHTYPFIVAVNKGKPMNVLIDNEIVIDTKVLRTRDGKLLEDENEDVKAEDIYINIIMLRLRSDKDEAEIPVVYKAVVDQYSPEAIGYIQSCLYNEYPDPDSVPRDAMLQDPENIHVINMSYYLKGDKTARISIMPFINKGPRKTSDAVWNDSGEQEQEHEVLFASCGWFMPYYKIDPLMKYPYKKGG